MASRVQISDDGRMLIIGAVVLILGPAILKSLFNTAGTAISNAADAVQTAATNAANNALDLTAQTPTYVGGGASWADIVSAFGETCGTAIVQGDTIGQILHCPWGWQDKLTALNASKMPPPSNTGGATGMWGLNGTDTEPARTLRRGPDGVYR